MNELQKKDLQYIWHPCSQMKDYQDFPPIIVNKGEGPYLYDTEGNRYIDIISSWWCNLLGHCNPKINAAVKKQLDKIEHVIFANFSHETAIELCEKLSKIIPQGLSKFNFSDNGSAAIECALKMSFQYHYQTGKTAKRHFMALTSAYHGETTGALSVGGVDLYSQIYKPLLFDIIRIEAPDCYRCSYGQERSSCDTQCFAAAEETFALYARKTTALIIEPLLQGAAGMRIYPAKYLQKLSQMCKHYDINLIADEIATGFGRTGKMFACEHAGITPDIMCISKGLTGGYLPMAITITTQEIYDAFYDDYQKGVAFMHSHTYSGNPLACSAALAVLDILEKENILKRSEKTAAYLHDQMTKAFTNHPNIGELRQIGLINALEIVKNKKDKQPFDSAARTGYQIYKAALKKGLLLRPLGDVIYFNPPLNITKEVLDCAVEACLASVLEVLPCQ